MTDLLKPAELDVYLKEKALLDRVAHAEKVQKAKVSEALKVLVDTHGKGPYDLGDGKPSGWVVAQRDGYYFMIPVKVKKAAAVEGTPNG